MTWIKFALWLSGLYLIYYLAVICWDALGGKHPGISENDDELTFLEHSPPSIVVAEEPVSGENGAIVSSGGVNLKALFNLAREEAIEYTRPISFLI